MLNHIDLMGRLTKEPELRTTQTGKSVVSFSLAVDRDFDRNKVDFFNCTAWNKTAEFVSRYFHKGQLVAVSGEMQSREYKDRNGNDRTAWEVLCGNVYFADSRREEKAVEQQQFDEVDDTEEELPF